MGDVGIATSADANSIFWNIAKHRLPEAKQAYLLTIPWLSDLKLNDVYLASLSGYHQIDEMSAVSASIRYFSLGNIQFTDFTGSPLQSFRPREFAIDAGYSGNCPARSAWVSHCAISAPTSPVEQ